MGLLDFFKNKANTTTNYYKPFASVPSNNLGKSSMNDNNKSGDAVLNIAREYFNQGLSKLKRNNFNGAIDDFNKSIQTFPINSGAFYNRGLAKHAFGDNEGAIQDFSKSIELNLENNDAEVYYNRGIVYGILKDHNSAILDFDAAIKIKPDFAVAYTNRATAKFNLYDDAGAISDCTRALELGDKSALRLFEEMKKNFNI